MRVSEVRSILATDVGSTTTKAILIEKRGDEYRLVTRGEVPTTVEAPWENVLIGVRKAIRRVEELTGRQLLDEDGELLRPMEGLRGVDLYVSTSSAGGGLQMMVAGLVKNISATSAHRAALGAGAVVLDVIAVDDGRSQSEQIARIRELRPDILLVSGGVEGGSVAYVAAVSETIRQANPQPRFGATYRLPLIYAGNRDAQDIVREICGDGMDVHVVENLRPRHDTENLGPAREAIHEVFMNHVMAQAPGYGDLMEMVDTTIMPTPGAVGKIISLTAEKLGLNIVGVDIGGATTDVFSSFGGTFTRTVSANLGMSYSICNVLEEAGFDKILRWVPFGMDEAQISDFIANKMVRPTTIPETLFHLVLEQALAREALRLSFEHHRSLARKVEKEKVGALAPPSLTTAKAYGSEIVRMGDLGLIVGSGGALSHAPRRGQAALILMDAFQPEGITCLAVDSIFMMPHLGVISSICPLVAAQVFDKDCLIRLGACVAPVGQARPGTAMAGVRVVMPDRKVVEKTIVKGEIERVPLPAGEEATVHVSPYRGMDVGAGKGRAVDVKVQGGVSGIILDGRGRPLDLPEDPPERADALTRWFQAMDAYPMDEVRELRTQFPVKASSGKGGKKRGGFFGFLRHD
jgi:uncharacterized protein (TIGR01319 family)